MYRKQFPDHPGLHHSQLRYRQLAMEHWSLKTRIKFYILPLTTSTILFIASLVLQIYAEYNSTLFHYASDESLRSVVNLDLITISDEINEGKLVHFVGPLSVDEEAFDPYVRIGFKTVILKREVEMFQWVEEELKNDLHRPSYEYSKQWQGKLHKNSDFERPASHENPKSFSLSNEIFYGKNVRIGTFSLYDTFLNTLKLKPLRNQSRKTHLKQFGNFYYLNNVESPNIGDIRINYYYALNISTEKVSILGKQHHASIVPYITSKNTEIAIIEEGKHSAEELLHMKSISVAFETNLLRMSSLIVFFVSFACSGKFLLTINFNLSKHLQTVFRISALFSLIVWITILFVSMLVRKPFYGYMFLFIFAIVLFVYNKKRRRFH